MKTNCFRCGKKLDSYANSGMLTISGFSRSQSTPVYQSLILCTDCWQKVYEAFEKSSLELANDNRFYDSDYISNIELDNNVRS